MSINVIGTGAYLPPKVVTNQELATMLDISPEWIERRTGIKERRFATEDTLLSMAVKASLKALENFDKNVDFIVCSFIFCGGKLPIALFLNCQRIGYKTQACFRSGFRMHWFSSSTFNSIFCNGTIQSEHSFSCRFRTSKQTSRFFR